MGGPRLVQSSDLKKITITITMRLFWIVQTKICIVDCSNQCYASL